MPVSGRVLSALLLAACLAFPAAAAEPQPDDAVSFELVAETWATTQNATVTLNVDAAVSDKTAAQTRTAMERAVASIAKADWHMTGFARALDKTGLERWDVSFEARLDEGLLSGLAEAAQKASKPGLQITLGGIDFSPSMAERETVRAALRTSLLKQASEQLAAVNAALPGRRFRLASVAFSEDGRPVPRRFNKALMLSAEGVSAPTSESVSEKIVLRAHVVCAAAPSDSPR